MSHHRNQSSRGYVLLLTLVLIALTGLSMVGLSRRGLEHAMASVEAEEDLQRRWGMLSCRTLVLPQAEQLLAQHEQKVKNPLLPLKFQLELGRQAFAVVVGDEQGKVNVNQLQGRGRQHLERAVRGLCAGSNVVLRVREPPTTRGSQGKQSPGFGSFGQLFDQPTALILLGRIDQQAPASRLTFWGDGRINFKRATREVLLEGTAPVLGSAQVDQLLSARQRQPGLQLEAALDGLELEEGPRAEAQRLLTDRSSCHSVWVICETKTRSWHLLAVQESNQSRHKGPITFTW